MKPVSRNKRRSFSSLAIFGVGLCCLAILLTAGPVFAETYYVRMSGTGNGTSWDTASSDLAGILNHAESGDQIWVAQGAYRPTTNRSDRGASFELQSGVALYGGFSNTGDPDSGDRDPATYITVLTGDIDSDDIVDEDGVVVSADLINGSNSYHVVYADNVDDTAVLDGFAVTGGMADDTSDNSGGGMYNYYSSPTVTNCTFSGNTADDGGGMYIESSNPAVTNCTFSGNSASYGGGMYNYHSSFAVTNCTFSGNEATYGIGGGMANDRSSPVVTNCTFSGNSASYGGGMYNYYSSSAVTNCTFSANEVTTWGGGMVNYWSSPTMMNCTFSGNTAGKAGGGMYNGSSSPAVTNCIFRNEAGSDEFGGDSSPILSCCVVQSGDVAVLYETDGIPVASGDLVLQPLADNGGPTMTCALGAGSIAIDKGTEEGAPSRDQRGTERPQGNGYDIGAYEARWFTVTVSADVGGVVSVEPYGVILSGDLTSVSKDFTESDTPTFVITPEESMDLTGVWLDSGDVSFDVTGATVTLDPLSADHTLEATFAVKTFSITTSAGAGGTVSPSGTTSVNWDGGLTVDITPCHGYTVSDVVVDGAVHLGSVTSHIFTNVKEEGHTLRATFAPDREELHQGGLESLSFPENGSAVQALLAGTAAVALPAGMSCDSFNPVASADLGDFWVETVDSGDFETEAAGAKPCGTFLCGVSFDVVASEVSGVGLLAMDLQLVVSEDSLSTACLEGIAADEEEAGLAEAFLSRVAILKVFSDDAYDLFDVALDSGADPLDFFTLSRGEEGLLVGLGLLIADAPAEGVDAVQAIPASGDCRFLIFDGVADGQFRDPLVAVEKDLSSDDDSGCNALGISGLALLMLPLLVLLKKR